MSSVSRRAVRIAFRHAKTKTADVMQSTGLLGDAADAMLASDARRGSW
jgi:hypothetical protein